MPSVRQWFPHARKEADGRKESSKAHKADVDPEAKEVVFIAGDGVEELGAVIGEDEVRDRVEEAEVTHAGARRGDQWWWRSCSHH